jgi:hypothetical protein
MTDVNKALFSLRLSAVASLRREVAPQATEGVAPLSILLFPYYNCLSTIAQAPPPATREPPLGGSLLVTTSTDIWRSECFYPKILVDFLIRYPFRNDASNAQFRIAKIKKILPRCRQRLSHVDAEGVILAR